MSEANLPRTVKGWTCTDWATPIPTPEELSTPEPTATLTGSDCEATAWYTPDPASPAPTPTFSVTVTVPPGEPAPAGTADVRLVDVPYSAASEVVDPFLLGFGLLVMLGLALVVATWSRTPRLGRRH